MKEILKSIQKTLITLIDIEKERKLKLCILLIILSFVFHIADTTLVLGILGAYLGANVSQKVKLKNNNKEKE